MSINSINYKKNKIIFNKLLEKKYIITKDSNDKHLLMIKTNDKQIKCKSIMFLTLFNNMIVWSDLNPFIDQYTKEISQIIREKIFNEKKYIINEKTQNIKIENLNDMINNLIKNQYNFIDKSGKSINCNWILTNINNGLTEYYMITDIIYY